MNIPINFTVKTYSPAMVAKPGGRSTFHLMISASVGKPEGDVNLPMDTCLVIDCSGSTNREIAGSTDIRLDKIKEAAEIAVKRLGPKDRIAIVMFNSFASVLLELTDCDAAGKEQAIDIIWHTLRSSGGTAFSTGLTAALRVLGPKTPGRNRAVLMLTDGNNESERDSKDRVTYPFALCATLKDNGITLYIAGLGVENELEEKLQEMARQNSVATNFRGLATGADVINFFTDVQTEASGTVIRNAQLRITPVTYAKVGNFERVSRSKQLCYLEAEEPARTTVNVGDIGSEETFDFYLNMGLILPDDIKEGRRSFGKIELMGEVVATGEKGTLKSGNVVVPFVMVLDPKAKADPEVNEMMGIAATQRELAVFEKTGSTEALNKAAEHVRKTQAFSRADAAKLLQDQITNIQATAAANPAAAQAKARQTKAFSAAERAALLSGLKRP